MSAGRDTTPETNDTAVSSQPFVKDARLLQALRHAPDAEISPSAITRQTILAQAQLALAERQELQASKAESGHLSLGDKMLRALQDLWKPRGPWNAGFATVLVMGFLGMMWRGYGPEQVPDQDSTKIRPSLGIQAPVEASEKAPDAAPGHAANGVSESSEVKSTSSLEPVLPSDAKRASPEISAQSAPQAKDEARKIERRESSSPYPVQSAPASAPHQMPAPPVVEKRQKVESDEKETLSRSDRPTSASGAVADLPVAPVPPVLPAPSSAPVPVPSPSPSMSPSPRALAGPGVGTSAAPAAPPAVTRGAEASAALGKEARAESASSPRLRTEPSLAAKLSATGIQTLSTSGWGQLQARMLQYQTPWQAQPVVINKEPILQRRYSPERSINADASGRESRSLRIAVYPDRLVRQIDSEAELSFILSEAESAALKAFLEQLR